jgi:hypothetical protein
MPPPSSGAVALCSPAKPGPCGRPRGAARLVRSNRRLRRHSRAIPDHGPAQVVIRRLNEPDGKSVVSKHRYDLYLPRRCITIMFIRGDNQARDFKKRKRHATDFFRWSRAMTSARRQRYVTSGTSRAVRHGRYVTGGTSRAVRHGRYVTGGTSLRGSAATKTVCPCVVTVARPRCVFEGCPDRPGRASTQ